MNHVLRFCGAMSSFQCLQFRIDERLDSQTDPIHSAVMQHIQSFIVQSIRIRFDCEFSAVFQNEELPHDRKQLFQVPRRKVCRSSSAEEDSLNRPWARDIAAFVLQFFAKALEVVWYQAIAVGNQSKVAVTTAMHAERHVEVHRGWPGFARFHFGTHLPPALRTVV